MKIIIDIPDEKVNKYGNDVLKMSFTFVDRIVTQADGYVFYQLPDRKVTNQEKFKEIFGLNISSRHIPNIPQIWNHRILLLSKENYIDCVDEWLQSEYDESIAIGTEVEVEERFKDSIESCTRIVDASDWLLTRTVSIEEREKLFSISLEATKVLRRLSEGQ